MKRYQTIPLNWFLPVLILGAFMAMMIASSIWRHVEKTSQLEAAAVERIQTRMANMQHRIESLLRLQESSLLAEEIAEFGALPEARFLALIDNRQQIINATELPWLAQAAAQAIPAFDASQFNNAQRSRQLALQIDTRHDYIMAYQPISFATLPGQIRPTEIGVLLLKYDLTPAKATIRRETFRRSISDIVTSGITMLLLMFALHRWLTMPLGYLRTEVGRISRGEFNTKVEINGHGELAELSAAINSMQTRLARSTLQLKTSYEELRASKENLAVTLSSIGDAVITTDTAGNVVQLNPVAEQLTGWPAQDASGQHLARVFNIINSQSRLAASNPVIRVLETGEIIGLANHTSLIARNGSEYHIADSAAPIRNKEGRVTGVVLVFHDVSEQYRHQAAIAASEAELRKITDILPGPVMRTDQNGRYIFVSSVYESWFGKRPEEVLGHTQLETFEPALYAQYEPHIKRAWLGEAASFEITLPDLKGGLRHALVHVMPDFDREGKVHGYFTVAADITLSKQAEQEALTLRNQLLQATKMEAMGHLTAGIAHDFNNMLGAMLGYTELSQHVIAKGNPRAADPYLSAIVKAGNRAKELITQMLTFSRKSSTTTGNEPSTLLPAIVKEVFSLLRSSIPSTIELNCIIPEEKITVCIQPIHLHQLLVNLGINARDAIGEYGKIDIILSTHQCHEAVCASCKHNFSGHYARLTVRDNGSGISTTILDNIFDPFFTTKGVGKGTGMGLSVVHGLVHSVQGHIQVETSSAGTAINILLPLANSQQTEENNFPYKLPASPNLLQGVRIMVVDDEPSMVTMMQAILELHGATVTIFSTPKEALVNLEYNPQIVDLVITDETMPGLSGTHLAEQMLKIKPALPIILCTGYSEHTTAELAASIGLAGFFYKPVKMSELLEKIKYVLQA